MKKEIVKAFIFPLFLLLRPVPSSSLLIKRQKQTNSELVLQSGRDIYLKGKHDLIPACVSCHGEITKGEGTDPSFPVLFPSNIDYYEKQLLDFKNGKRHSDFMSDISQNLDLDDINALKIYWASLWPLESKDRVSVKATKDKIQEVDSLGAQLASKGKIDVRDSVVGQYTISCFSCHGPRGEGVPPFFPRISGQKKDYLLQEMKAFREGRRKNDLMGMMNRAMSTLKDEEIKALAEYLSTL